MKKISGFLFCFLIAIIANFFGRKIPVMGGPVIAMFIGMIISIFIKNRIDLSEGINFTSKKVLQLSIIFLGFSLNLNSIVRVGIQSLPVIVSTVLISLLVSYLLYTRFNLTKNIGILIGVGSSICGGSAIAATSPIIKAKDEEITQSLSVIFLFNVIAAIIFPYIGMFLGMSESGFSIFAGTAINDTSSVTAAATVWDGIYQGSNTINGATIVKLTRTLAIIPITFILSIIENKNRSEIGKFSILNIFPLFILLFILASIINTLFNFEIFVYLPKVSKFLIMMAMSAIGYNTDILDLVKNAKKSIYLGLICWISIIIVSLLMQYILKIW